MTNVLISYYIEAVNALNSVAAIAFIHVICIKPLPLPAAQFVIIATHSCGSLMTALGSAVSCFQILYVIKFELIFSLDPQLVGWRIFIFLTFLIFVPNFTFGVYRTIQGRYVDKAVTLFNDDKQYVEGLQFPEIYSYCWIMFYLVISFIAFVFLPIFYKNRSNYNDNLPPQRTISLQRYLLGASGIFTVVALTSIMVRLNNSGRVSIDNLITFFALVLLLAYHLTEKETRTIVRKYFFKLLKIEIPPLNPERSSKTCSTSQQLTLASLSGTAMVPCATSALSKNRLINVSSLNNDLEMTENNC
jgi:hypothetical protein